MTKKIREIAQIKIDRKTITHIFFLFLGNHNVTSLNITDNDFWLLQGNESSTGQVDLFTPESQEPNDNDSLVVSQYIIPEIVSAFLNLQNMI